MGEANKASDSKLREEMGARMDKQRDEINENIRNNKNLADNADKDLDNRIKSTNEVVQKNKDKEMADHTLALKNISDLDTKTANANKDTNAKLAKHTDDTASTFNEKQDQINKNKENHTHLVRTMEEKFKETDEKEEKNHKSAMDFSKSLVPRIDKINQLLDME